MPNDNTRMSNATDRISSKNIQTDPQKTEDALRKSEAQLRALNENIGNGMVYQINTGSDGSDRRFTYISSAVIRMHGITPDEAIREPLRIYNQVSPEYQTLLAEKEAEAVSCMSTFKIDVQVDYPPGKRSWRRFVSTPRFDSDGCLLWDGIEFDVSEEKRQEAESEKLKSQLIQAQKIESIGKLAGGVAHDFNNMLSVIIGHAEIAMGMVHPDNPVHANLQEILAAANRSADLTRQLLAFARKQTIAPRVMDINETVSEILKMLQRMIGEDVTLAFQPGHDLWPVKIDPGQIQQILSNLCINARDAMTGFGIITIETANCTSDEALWTSRGVEPGDYVLLSVSDNGCGMDKNVMNHIFEPFYTTKDVGKGTGLGLSMVYGIVRQNQGFINVCSEPQRGSTFRIYLPRLEDISPLQKPANPAADPDSIEQGSETILLVEDEPSILKIGQTMLEKLGYRVLAVPTAHAAIALAGSVRETIDLLITDVIMPEMNGMELSKRILERRPAIKVLFMSGYSRNAISKRGILDPDVHYLQKPFSSRSLSENVRMVLNSDDTKHSKDLNPSLTVRPYACGSQVFCDFNADAWKQEQAIMLTHHMGEEPAHRPMTFFKIAYDTHAVHVIFHVEDRYVKAVAEGYQGRVYQDSCVEFFFSPGPACDKGYFNLEINCCGTALFEFHPPGEAGFIRIPEASFHDITVSASLSGPITQEITEPVTWTVACRIPYHVLEPFTAVTQPSPGVSWRGNFHKCADKTSRPHWLTWAPIDYPTPKFHLPEHFGFLTFT